MDKETQPWEAAKATAASSNKMRTKKRNERNVNKYGNFLAQNSSTKRRKTKRKKNRRRQNKIRNSGWLLLLRLSTFVSVRGAARYRSDGGDETMAVFQFIFNSAHGINVNLFVIVYMHPAQVNGRAASFLLIFLFAAVALFRFLIFRNDRVNWSAFCVSHKSKFKLLQALANRN